MSKRYYIGVVAGEHVDFARSAGLCGFSHGKEAPVAKLRPGDRFVYYSPRRRLKEGEVVQAFTAIGTVTGDAAYERDWAGRFTAFVRDAVYDDAQNAPVKPLLERLSFVRNPHNWGMAFRRSFFEVSAADFALIAGAMGVAP